MGYSIFKFGAIYLDDKIQLIPQRPERAGDIPQYDGRATISIGLAGKEESITWVKPDGLSLLIADRALLTNASWDDLDKNGLVRAKPILIDGQYFRCRLLQVGKDKDTPNEWDKAIHETGEKNSLWHWSGMYFFGADIPAYSTLPYCVVRGYRLANGWYTIPATNRYVDVGFRPALEPLLSDDPIPNINLDGINFQLSSLPGGEGFCPILQPAQGNVFKDVPAGGKVRMYTVLEGGKPIHFGATVEDANKLTLTDRYFGDEYLVPWVISNGIAVASQSLLQKGEN